MSPLGDRLSALVDGGEMDCGSGLLLLITRAMRRLDEGDLLAVRSQEPSVVTDLPVISAASRRVYCPMRSLRSECDSRDQFPRFLSHARLDEQGMRNANAS